MSRNIVTARAALEVASHEALIREAYKDSVGVLTWCVGMTNATGHRIERYIGSPASLQHCMNVYAWALCNYADGVRQAFKGHKLTEAQFAAALSFHWNTGAIKSATWVKRWKAGDVSGARKAFMWYRKPASIIDRRKKERTLFFDGKWSNDGTMTEYTRVHGNLSPDWGSARRIDVSQELAEAFADIREPKIDQKPDPDASVKTPTLSPKPTNIPPTVDIEPPADVKPAGRFRRIREFFAGLSLALANLFNQEKD